MKIITHLLVATLAFVAVTDAADMLRQGCDDAGAVTPAPTTPTPTTPAPTTGKPNQTTPAPTTGNPDQTTPAPTTPGPTTPGPTTPGPTTPAPTTPVPTTPAPTTPAPTTPAPTTPTPTKPTSFDKNQEYTRDGIDCAGFLRLPRPGTTLIKDNCVRDFKVLFTSTDAKVTDGCVVCEPRYGKFEWASPDAVPLCGGLPLCTRLGSYFGLTEADLMCVLNKNGSGPVEDNAVCGLGDN